MTKPMPDPIDITIIKPSKGWSALNFRELFRYRELLYFLAWRDIKIRYKQTILGASWAVLQPFFTMIVFTIFFGKMAKIPSEGVPYPIFSYAGLLPWTYFANAVSLSGNSLVGSSNLITKVYFPRLYVPMGATLAGLVDYVIAITVLVAMMIWYRFVPRIEMLLLPMIMLLCLLASTGVGMWLSAMNVKYRDIKYTIPFLIQLWLFATPVIYPTSMLSEKYRWIMALNPMAGIIEAHRAMILGNKPIDWSALAISSSIIILIFVIGAFYFKRMERSFADVI
jgi:lipopolysaccharide transport system permease protein